MKFYSEIYFFKLPIPVDEEALLEKAKTFSVPLDKKYDWEQLLIILIKVVLFFEF